MSKKERIVSIISSGGPFPHHIKMDDFSTCLVENEAIPPVLRAYQRAYLYRQVLGYCGVIPNLEEMAVLTNDPKIIKKINNDPLMKKAEKALHGNPKAFKYMTALVIATIQHFKLKITFGQDEDGNYLPLLIPIKPSQEVPSSSI